MKNSFLKIEISQELSVLTPLLGRRSWSGSFQLKETGAKRWALFGIIASQSSPIMPLVDYGHSMGLGLSLPNQIILNYIHKVISIYPCKHLYVPFDTATNENGSFDFTVVLMGLTTVGYRPPFLNEAMCKLFH